VSITYRLELGALVGPEAVMAAMVETGAQVTEDYGGSLRGGGWFDVDRAEYDPPDPIEDAFGFVPAVDVAFILDKFGDFEAQETDMLRLVLGVLARIPGDALLHYEHDEVWLLRSGERLTVNDSLWTREQLALITQPYERARLEFGQSGDGPTRLDGGDLGDEGGQIVLVEEVGGSDGDVGAHVVEGGAHLVDGDAREGGPG
jgi:hypothetical protein